MKAIIGFLIVFIFSCSDAKQPLPASMKGYELYSWQKNGNWNFTLMTGTNRNKTFDEIISVKNIETNDAVKINVSDVEELKDVFNRLPSGQIITWVSRVKGVEWPPLPIVKEITAYSKSRKLILQRT